MIEEEDREFEGGFDDIEVDDFRSIQVESRPIIEVKITEKSPSIPAELCSNEESKTSLVKYQKHKWESPRHLPINFGDILSRAAEEEKVVHCSTLVSKEENDGSEEAQSKWRSVVNKNEIKNFDDDYQTAIKAAPISKFKSEDFKWNK